MKKFVFICIIVLSVSLCSCKDTKSAKSISSESTFEKENVSEISSGEIYTEISNTKPNVAESKTESAEQSAKTSQSSALANAAPTRDESQSSSCSSATVVNNEVTKTDATAVANRIIDYLNDYRNTVRSGGLQQLSGLTEYAKYRSKQLTEHFAHDTNDERAAATAVKYGQYINPAQFGLEGEPYYTAYTREAIGYTAFKGSADEVAKHFADMCRNSPNHWAYIGSYEYSFVGVGITYHNGFWYMNISVTNTNGFER